MSTQELPKAVLEELGRFDRTRETILSVANHVRELEAIAARHKQCKVILQCCGSYYPYVQIKLCNADHIREAAPVLRDLARAGYRIKDKACDEPGENARVWRLRIVGKPSSAYVLICFHCCLIWDDRASCRFVEVGSQTLPKYKLVCGGKP